MQQQTGVLPHDSGGGAGGLNDLQFTTSVDPSIQQNVQIDPTRAGQPAFVGQQQDAIGSGPMNTAGGGSVGVADGGMMDYVRGCDPSRIFHESSHPVVALFHLLFKVLALFVYIFGGWFAGSSNFVTITVVCIILLACDFWVVKNVTGRLLVGLRWWNKVNEDGSTKWIFESAETKYENKFDNRIFWSVTYGTPFVWGALFFVGLLKFEFGWLLVVVIALTLSSSNVYGYWKCSSDQKVKFQQLVTKGAEMGAAAALKGNVIGTLSNFAQMGRQQQQQQPQQGNFMV